MQPTKRSSPRKASLLTSEGLEVFGLGFVVQHPLANRRLRDVADWHRDGGLQEEPAVALFDNDERGADLVQLEATAEFWGQGKRATLTYGEGVGHAAILHYRNTVSSRKRPYLEA